MWGNNLIKNVSLKPFGKDLKLTQHKSTILHFSKKSIKGGGAGGHHG